MNKNKKKVKKNLADVMNELYQKMQEEESNANQSVKTLFGNKSKLEDTEQIIIDLRKMDYIKLMVYCKKRKIKPENLVEDKILEILKEDEKCL